MTTPRYIPSRRHKFVTRSTGSDLSVNSTAAGGAELAAATNGPGAGGFDLVLAADAGDTIEAGFAGLCGNQAVELTLDFATIVSAAVVNYLAANGATWKTNGPFYMAPSTLPVLTGSVFYTVQAGDLASGLVTLRPYYRTVTASARTIYTGSNSAFQAWARNIGPPDPN